MTRWIRPVRLVVLVAIAAVIPLFARSALQAAPGSSTFVMNVSAQPAVVAPGGTFTVTVTLTNSGAGSSHVRITDTLPSGFRYDPASITLNVDGVGQPYYEPVITDQAVSWGMTPYPGSRAGNIYGMHTFVQDACQKTSLQLDQSLAVASGGGYVKELFYNIDAGTTGPSQCWIDFVNGAYDRGLTPVIRLQGVYGNSQWNKPQPDSPGVYTSIANAFKNVVAGLPRRDGFTLYIELWNEENLNAEWSGQCNPVEYAQFFKQTADAIHGLGDARIKVLNGGLSPGGSWFGCDYLAFIDQMSTVPGALGAIDVWATHLYPGNHPPEFNQHNLTATSWQNNLIDSYMFELSRLEAHGRWGLRVLATEAGYNLGNDAFGVNGFVPIDESNRADYISRAFRDYWSYWPEVIGIAPYELTDPNGGWTDWNWIEPNGAHHAEYDAVQALAKPPAAVGSKITFQYRVIASDVPGTYTSDYSAYSNDGRAAAQNGATPVRVLPPPQHTFLSLVGRGMGTAPVAPQAPVNAAAPRGPLPRAVAYDRTRSLLSYADNGTLVVREENGAERRGTYAGQLGSLAVDEARGQIVASDPANGRLVWFDEATLREQARVEGLARPNGLATGGDTLYAAESGADRLAVIDLRTRAVVRRAETGPAPYAVVFNPTNGRVYVGQGGGHDVDVFDRAGNPQTTVELGGLGPVQGLAVDARANRVYAVLFATSRTQTIAEIDAATDRAIAHFGGEDAQPLGQAYGIAVDETRGRVFVNDRGGLVALDPARGTFTRVDNTPEIGYAFGLVFDPRANSAVRGGVPGQSLRITRAP